MQVGGRAVIFGRLIESVRGRPYFDGYLVAMALMLLAAGAEAIWGRKGQAPIA